MKSQISIVLVILLICTSLHAEQEPVVVRHLQPTGEILKDGYYPNMWFYRTEIKNNTKSPLKVVWFEGYIEENGNWYAANILGHTMRGEEFSTWYSEGSKVINGVIQPGEIAACDVNWHGGLNKEYINVKWSYILVDDKGKDYFVEEVVDPKIVKYVHYGSNKLNSQSSAAGTPKNDAH
jgi:hypothetical protein